MNKSGLFLKVALSIIILGIGYLIYNIEWETVEEEVGLTRPAQLEPLLAATLFLENHQKTLATLTTKASFLRSGEITLPKSSSLIIDEAALSEYKHLMPALITWIQKGGHLIYTLSSRREQLNLEHNAVITLTDVTVEEAELIARQESALITPTSNGNITEEDHSFSIYLAHRYTFGQCNGREILKKDSEDILICEESIGEGFITFVPSINAISNDGLRHLDHGEYLLWLTGANTQLFYLPSTQSTGWLMLLWQWCWQVVLLIITLGALTMWQVSMRLGLAVEPSTTTKNLFAQHIEAVGHYLFKHKHDTVLKNALLTDLANAVEKRQPRYKQLSIDEQAMLISTLTGKEMHDIHFLLSKPLPEDENTRIEFIKLFKELRNLL